MFDINCTMKSSKKNDSTVLSIKGVMRDPDVLDDMSNPVFLSIGDRKIIVNGEDLMTAIANCIDNGNNRYSYRLIRRRNNPYDGIV